MSLNWLNPKMVGLFVGFAIYDNGKLITAAGLRAAALSSFLGWGAVALGVALGAAVWMCLWVVLVACLLETAKQASKYGLVAAWQK